jgi:hypothetical protein
MSDKSYVSMEQLKCRVCGHDFDSGVILMDRRLRERFERHTLTGWGFCPECQKNIDDGFMALIGVDEKQSVVQPGDTIKPENAHRTGNIAWIRIEAAKRIFGEDATQHGPMAFCEDEVIKVLKQRMEQADESEHESEHPTKPAQPDATQLDSTQAGASQS